VTSSATSPQSVAPSITIPMAPSPHPSAKNGWPAWRSTASSSPAERNVRIVRAPSAESSPKTWAKVRVRTFQRTPAHARSSWASGSARQARRTATTASSGASA
jgi:hypothetical protein